MTDAAKPASLRRLAAISVLMASAFTSSRAAAVIATPASFVSLLPYIARGALWESADRDGMVVFGRYRPALDVLLSVAVVLLGFGIGIAALVLGAFVAGPTGLLVVLLLVLLVFGTIGAGALLLLTGSSLTGSVGRETPRGRRWTLMGLAQRPGTRLSALLLARQLLDEVPAGGVVVAVAGSPELAAGYTRLGFTRGSGLRVHLVAPPPKP